MRNAVSLASLVGLTLVTFGVFGVLAGPSAWAAGPLPALPSGPAAPATPAPASSAAPAAGQAGGADADAPGSDAPSALERVRRGIVLVERDGHLLGFGTVLGGDGRILTSLSALGQGDAAEIRYADGTTVHAKVAHKDAAWD
ncbi:MAG TPA: hypothetical protein VGI39_32940, partial [Polyangiaceae bacterium]